MCQLKEHEVKADAEELSGDALLPTETLLKQLADRTQYRRCQAAGLLGIRGDASSEVVKSLIERLSDNAACVRDLALSSLSELLLNPTAELEQKRQMLAEELLPGTLPMAKDASELVRRTATKTLGRIGQLDGQDSDKLVESIVKDLIEKLTIGPIACKSRPSRRWE